MAHSEQEEILRKYVSEAKVLQLATIDQAGYPSVCHVWYALDWPLQELIFTSNPKRNHSQYIAANPKVAGGILDMTLEALGQKVRGVSFAGTARVVGDAQLDRAVDTFKLRWTAVNISASDIRKGVTANRLYAIAVERWFLHDEIGSPESPRFELSAEEAAR